MPIIEAPIFSLLVFPDAAMPCKDFRSDGGCTCNECLLIHDEDSSLLAFIELLDNAQKSMDICVPNAITCEELTDAVIAAHERGVTVRVIANMSAHENCVKTEILKMLEAGILVRDGPRKGESFCILDDAMVATGPFDWTREAVTDHSGHLKIFTDEYLRTYTHKEFEEKWRAEVQL